MTEGFIRHFISFIGTVIAFLVWIGGYFSGSASWWWSAFLVLIVYGIVYALLEV